MYPLPVKCMHCGHEKTIQFEKLKISKTMACLECEKCRTIGQFRFNFDANFEPMVEDGLVFGHIRLNKDSGQLEVY